jgi:single-stranded DNA-binding protein
MIKAIITNAVISKGYNGAPALNFSGNNGTTTAVQFKIGYKTYDSRAENNHRYINLAVKAFGQQCERVQKMKIAESSYVNIVGRMDEETWEENGQKRSRIVIIVEDIEYASNGGGKGNGSKGTAPAANGQNQQPVHAAPPPPQQQPAAPPPQANQAGMPPEFTGYAGFGEENPFFPGS